MRKKTKNTYLDFCVILVKAYVKQVDHCCVL